MRIYLSSTFEDLKEYRTACLRVLRQLGHEVIAMEDYVAESSIPVGKVVDDVETCDIYVLLVAWRYGYVPNKARVAVHVEGAKKGETSITEYEYLAAAESGVRRLIFLLHERAPWPPPLMDGFGVGDSSTKGLAPVRAFRERLQTDQMVSYFKTPEDLEARVSAAIASVGLRRQMIENSAMIHSGAIQGIAAACAVDDSGLMPLQDLVGTTPSPEVAMIDIQTIWWSTRLYFLAAVGDLLTDVRRIVITEAGDFVGMTSTSYVRRMLGNLHPEIARFERDISKPLPKEPSDALSEVLLRWRRAFKEQERQTVREEAVQTRVTRAALTRWLGDGMLTAPLRVDDPDQTTVLDLLRVLDYPNDFVPVVGVGERSEPTPSLRIINRGKLDSQLAKTYVDDLMTSLGLRAGR